MAEIVLKSDTNHFVPIWDEVNISQALADKNSRSFYFALKEANLIGNNPHYPHAP